ncbi:protein WHAT'S THIS FACTOR 9, mitochondrial [Tanacetum coccineum]
MYPSLFQEFTGPHYNLPCFRLTPQAIKLNHEEQCVYRDFKDDLEQRLVKFVLMSVENRLPFKVIKGMLWYFGLPDDYLQGGLGECFEVVEIGDGLKGLTVVKSEKILSVIQKNMLRSGVYSGGEMEAISIPLYPYKGLRNNMCTTILKEPYFEETAIEAHPLAEVKKKYILLVKESKVILKKRNSKMELDGGDTHDGRHYLVIPMDHIATVKDLQRRTQDYSLGPPYHDFSLMDILPEKSTRSWELNLFCCGVACAMTVWKCGGCKWGTQTLVDVVIDGIGGFKCGGCGLREGLAMKKKGEK